MLDPNLGQYYFDHYECFLRKLSRRSFFELDNKPPSIQILEYDNVFTGCRVFCSLGFSKLSNQASDEYQEIVVVADNGFSQIPRLLAMTLFFMADREIPIVDGLSKGGLGDLNSNFTTKYDKDAIYFTDPFPFPDEFKELHLDNTRGYIYLGVFISRKEYMFIRQYGAEKFEQLMGEHEIDPFNLLRSSVV